ncbi:hypothetical protein BGZ82_000244 [Podila clonocystis]|nr:hypothetical protein BGZ82_000244 [Podila clonocystis]
MVAPSVSLSERFFQTGPVDQLLFAIAYSLVYDATEIKPRLPFSTAAQVTDTDSLTWITSRHSVLTHNLSDNIPLGLDQVADPGEPVSAPSTAALPPQAPSHRSYPRARLQSSSSTYR